MSSSSALARPRKIVAEIISIGDEISTGMILDTNAQYLSQSLSDVGVRVLYHSTIGDDMSAMVAAFATAFRRADVVVVTGGLGPTQDDLTRQAAAEVLGVGLEFDRPSFEHTQKLFKRRGIEMPESNRIQAYFPEGSRPIFNPNGTAPGFIIDLPREKLPRSPLDDAFPTSRQGEFIALTFPGVPAEMKEMWGGEDGRAAVLRFVERLSGGRPTVYRAKLIHSFGAGESVVEARLPNLIARDHFPTVGITAKNSVITLRIFAEGDSEETCEKQIDETSRIIYSRVGELVYGEDDETFSEVVCRNLRAQCRKVGVFEWGTRGVLSQTIQSDVLAFGRVFGDSERDEFARLFGDSASTPVEKRQTAPDRETFSASFYVDEPQIAEELRKLGEAESRGQNVDYYLAIGPYPKERDADEPGSDALQTVDVAFVDLRDRERPKLRRETFVFGGQPAMIDALFCNRALDMLRKYQ